MINEVKIIAEVKTESPFGFKSVKIWEELFCIADEIGDIISVHTNRKWGGSLDLVERAKKLTSKPILAKGIHPTDRDVIKAHESGADYILVVGRIPEVYNEKCIIEPLRLEELYKIPDNSKVLWNTRNLHNGKPKYETFEQAREIWKGWLCQASYIRTIKDMKLGADAVLVGSYLNEFYASLKGLK